MRKADYEKVNGKMRLVYRDMTEEDVEHMPPAEVPEQTAEEKLAALEKTVEEQQALIDALLGG